MRLFFLHSIAQVEIRKKKNTQVDISYINTKIKSAMEKDKFFIYNIILFWKYDDYVSS